MSSGQNRRPIVRLESNQDGELQEKTRIGTGSIARAARIG